MALIRGFRIPKPPIGVLVANRRQEDRPVVGRVLAFVRPSVERRIEDAGGTREETDNTVEWLLFGVSVAETLVRSKLLLNRPQNKEP